MTDREWLLRPADDRLAQAIAQRFALPELLGRILAARGVDDVSAEDFLDPTLRRLLPDPHRLVDMAKAAERVARAIVAGETVAILGDYDVDGATAAALLLRYLRALGLDPRLYVPDRIKEGYGPNTAALRQLHAAGASLVITVDCGINADEPLTAAAALGLDVIVVDHHQAAARLPPAAAIVNPNRLDDDSGLGHLAAVGVAFLLIVATNRRLRQDGWFTGARAEPDLRQWLDLVALGTVCDVVPLRGLNRAFVVQGLKVMARRLNPGLAQLADLARLEQAPTSFDVGFVIGPRINAGGRVGESDLGARLLSSDDREQCGHWARRLDQLNQERRAIEHAVHQHALTILPAAEEADERSIIWLAGEHWHPGVVGIVASRVSERYRRPAFIIALHGEHATASARSIAGLDIGAAVNAAVQAGLARKGGGHAMAAGFSTTTALLPDLRAFLAARLSSSPAITRAAKGLIVDGWLSIAAAAEVAISLGQVGPFGNGNPEPRLLLSAARVAQVTTMGEQHLRCQLIDAHGRRLDACAFRCASTALGRALREHEGTTVDIAGRLQHSTYRGRARTRLIIDDIAVGF